MQNRIARDSYLPVHPSFSNFPIEPVHFFSCYVNGVAPRRGTFRVFKGSETAFVASYRVEIHGREEAGKRTGVVVMRSRSTSFRTGKGVTRTRAHDSASSRVAGLENTSVSPCNGWTRNGRNTLEAIHFDTLEERVDGYLFF